MQNTLNNPTRNPRHSMSPMVILLAAGLSGTGFSASANSDSGFLLTWEGGPAWVSRNNVRIPGDTGTRFDMTDLTGSGPDLAMRFYGQYSFNDRHSVRLNLAPFEVSGSGRFDEPVEFAGETFAVDSETAATYKFSNYRLTYRYTFHRSEQWELGAGLAVLMRDAEVRLRQNGVESSDDDIGFVPLLHFYSAYHFNRRHSLVFDIEGAGASQGRAIDASLMYHYQLPSGWSVGAGYRTLEGGADNDDVYNFAWIHYAVVSVSYRF